eukprot:COSAG06_NODE_216_length_20108_cov_9.428857_3_plen_49_part_00
MDAEASSSCCEHLYRRDVGNLAQGDIATLLDADMIMKTKKSQLQLRHA